MGFTDKLAQGDGLAVVLNCGFCNQLASEGHYCEFMKQSEETLGVKSLPSKQALISEVEKLMVLNCSTCGQPAQENHKCAGKRYLRNPKVVMVHPFEGQPEGCFVVRNKEGDCSYVVTKEVLKREYEELF